MDFNDLEKKMKNDRSIFERAAMYIPGYGGYRNKNLRRDQDREVRNTIVKILKAAKIEIDDVYKDTVGTGDMDLSKKVEKVRVKLDTFNTKVEKSVGGYSGIWASIKKMDVELINVVESDVKMLEVSDSVRSAARKLRDTVGEGSFANDVREMERLIDSSIETYDKREFVLKGLTEE